MAKFDVGIIFTIHNYKYRRDCFSIVIKVERSAYGDEV